MFFGRDPKTGRNFVLQSCEGGGWGGRSTEDGESASVSVCQGDVRNAAIEGMELKCPVIVEKRELRTDSGGAGKHRGGLGIDVLVYNLVKGRWNFQGSIRRGSPPWGLKGGRAGTSHTLLLKEPGDRDFGERNEAGHPVAADSQVIVRTGGGGGWGDPLERDPDKVRWDVIEGFVSRAAADRDYGVVLLDPDLAVDTAATADLRKRLREATPTANESRPPDVTRAVAGPLR